MFVVTSPTGVVAKYCDERVCLSLSVRISLELHAQSLPIFTNFSVHVAYGHGSVLLRQGNEIPRGRAVLGVFFPIDNALYSIAFGTHTKRAEPIEIPFGLTTRVGRRYHVLGGGPNPQRGRGNFGGKLKSTITSLPCCAKGIIQLPITSCSRRDHSLC